VIDIGEKREKEKKKTQKKKKFADSGKKAREKIK